MLIGRQIQRKGLHFLSLTAGRSRRPIHWNPFVQTYKEYLRDAQPVPSQRKSNCSGQGISSPGEYDAESIATSIEGKVKMMKAHPPKRKKFSRAQIEGTPEEVLTFETQKLLRKAASEHADESNGDAKPFTPLEPGTQLELEIVELSSTGDGLAFSPDRNHIYVVPFSVPGDLVLAETVRQKPHPTHTSVSFVKVVRPSPKREGVTPGCKYFAKCSGCQLQMIPYEEQLKHKKTIVEKAFQNFSNLDPSLIPPVGETIGSPLQYAYRTKLTPHFDGPPKRNYKFWTEDPPPIGFSMKNHKVLDIEQCPIGTPILNEGMAVERKKVHETYKTRKKGVTILLRESTKRIMKRSSPSPSSSSPGDADAQSPPDSKPSKTDAHKRATSLVPPSAREIQPDDRDYTVIPVPKPIEESRHVRLPDAPEITYIYPTHKDVKTYTSLAHDFTTEYVGDFTFVSRANSFFQNNNSVLPTFMNYVREHCIPPPPSSSSTSPTSAPAPPSSTDTVQTGTGTGTGTITDSPTTTTAAPIKYLLDAYCGSGLFAVCLSPLFSSVLGIDIDAMGIEAARENARLNNIPNAGFIAADAHVIFADVPFPPDQSLVVIDPPRKGASVDFLRQLCNFGPKRVVYVSCNVHTQARDVGMLVTGLGKKWRYEIEGLRGFDFFPQTGHVEGLCFLSRVPQATSVEA
ncbi:tRNA(m5U54)methyltransferase [Rhinocladiella similis]